jgi:hypothetical protein
VLAQNRWLWAVCAGLVGIAARGAEVGRDAATAFFRTHPNEVDLQEQTGSILLANRQTGLEFRPGAAGFEWVRLYDIAADQDCLTPPAATAARPLFEVRMALDPKHVGKDERTLTKSGGIQAIERLATLGDAFYLGSQCGGQCSWSQAQAAGAVTLTLSWKGVDVREDKGVLDIDVTVTLRAGDPLSCWRIAIRNQSARYGIERARLPLVPLAPIGDPKHDVFLYPKWRGGMVEDPFHAPAGFGENYHTEGAYYPYYVNMQFWALYSSETGRGVYLGTRDPTPNMSHVLVRNTASEITWSVSHFPPNMSIAAEDYAQPYDAVVGPFQGDWYDACQMYRAWALRQTWCRKGPLATRADIPLWYKETPLHFYTQLGDSATGTHSVAENLPLAAAHFSQWLRWAGVRMPVIWYTWEKDEPRGLSVGFDTPFSGSRYPGPDSNNRRWAGLRYGHNAFDGNYPEIAALDDFAVTCKRLRRQGGMVCPYVCIQLFNQGPLENAPYASEAKFHMAREAYGSLMAWTGLGEWFPCVSSPWWQKRMVDTCTTLLEREHVGGYYLDVMHGMGVAPCFWTPHGHSAGGGSSGTLGVHRLADAIRTAVKARDAEVVTMGENPAENMIDVIDGVMYQRTLWPENKVPLFATVYQDYIRRHGLELSADTGWEGRYQDVWRQDAFFIECASLFVEGAQVGRLRLRPRDITILFEKPEHQEMIAFLGRIVGYYKQRCAKKFLVYGQLVRPLTFRAPSPMPGLTYTCWDVATPVEFPALQSGVFRAPDGELGVFVVNAGTAELAFAAELDPGRYAGAAQGGWRVDVVEPEGATRRVLDGVQGVIPLSGSLPGRHITLFRVAHAVP